jgi:antitoxin component YwqK of YwqJK toxin-antitoxin module
MKLLLISLTLFTVFSSSAQRREEFFNFSFRPTKTSPFYYVITEKKDSVWDQSAYYISTSRMASECSYKDEKCSIPHGGYISYNVDGFAQLKGMYGNGKREGLWLGYNDKGNIVDSGMYVNGHLKGVRMKWYANGMASDSMNFDGSGNGVQVSWYDDGAPASAGYWTQDTLKKGRWKYFFHDGKIKATQDYVDGKLTVCNCFTEKGEAIDTALCREKEAKPAGAIDGWTKFLQKSLIRIVENLATKGAKPGNYTVIIKFVVLEDGTISDLIPLTKFGHGIEEEVMAAMRRAPKWEPARQFGKTVKSYHTQPITFIIQQQ